MTQPEPESPCVRSCVLDPETDICLGCHRTLIEITNWTNYSVEEKLEVRGRIERRQRERRHKL